MKVSTDACRAALKSLLRIVGIGATGASMVSLSMSGQVFALQFLQDGTPVPIPEMVYSPELQLMVKPGTDDPIFTYSRGLLRGEANGEYQMAPLITCPGSPGCPSPPPTPTNTVTPGGGPNGPGPQPDSD